MSDDTQRPGRPGEHEEPRDEVEAHKHHFGADDDATAEDEGDDEVEAHKHHIGHHKMQ